MFFFLTKSDLKDCFELNGSCLEYLKKKNSNRDPKMALRKRKTRLRKGKGGKGELENERYLGDFETIALVHMRILSGVTAQREDIKSIDLGQITCTLAYTQRMDSECHSHRLHALNEERKKEKKKKKKL